MEIQKSNKLSKVVAKEETRYAIRAAKLTKRDDGSGEMAATDGRRLAVVPVAACGSDDDGALIPLAALKAAERGASAKAPVATIACNGTIRVQGGPASPVSEFPNRDDGDRFPDYRSVLDSFDTAKRSKRTVAVSLNAKFLYELAQALGSDSVRLELLPDDEGKGEYHHHPIGVEPICGGAGRGLLMPISSS